MFKYLFHFLIKDIQRDILKGENLTREQIHTSLMSFTVTNTRSGNKRKKLRKFQGLHEIPDQFQEYHVIPKRFRNYT